MQRYHSFNYRHQMEKNAGRQERIEEKIRKSREKLNNLVPGLQKATWTSFEPKNPQNTGENVFQR